MQEFFDLYLVYISGNSDPIFFFLAFT
jgi:hypothetical protein